MRTTCRPGQAHQLHHSIVNLWPRYAGTLGRRRICDHNLTMLVARRRACIPRHACPPGEHALERRPVGALHGWLAISCARCAVTGCIVYRTHPTTWPGHGLHELLPQPGPRSSSRSSRVLHGTPSACCTIVAVSAAPAAVPSASGRHSLLPQRALRSSAARVLHGTPSARCSRGRLQRRLRLLRSSGLLALRCLVLSLASGLRDLLSLRPFSFPLASSGLPLALPFSRRSLPLSLLPSPLSLPSLPGLSSRSRSPSLGFKAGDRSSSRRFLPPSSLGSSRRRSRCSTLPGLPALSAASASAGLRLRPRPLSLPRPPSPPPFLSFSCRSRSSLSRRGGGDTLGCCRRACLSLSPSSFSRSLPPRLPSGPSLRSSASRRLPLASLSLLLEGGAASLRPLGGDR